MTMMGISFNLPAARRMALALFASLVLASGRPPYGAFYSSHDFDPAGKSATSIRDLMNGVYTEQDREHTTAFWMRELAKLEAEAPKHADDADFQDDHAMLLYHAGKVTSAELLWKQLLKKDPDRFQTMANYGTALQSMGRYNDAAPLIEKTAAMRPEMRAGVEKLQSQMLQYMMRHRADNSYGQKHIFIASLTPVWDARKPPPKTFREVSFPVPSAQGVAELMRTFPKFGDGWLVMGMLLEHEGDYSKALTAYRLALKAGANKQNELKAYIQQFAPYAESLNPIHYAGKSVLTLFILVAGGFIGFKLWRTGRAVYDDIAETRRANAPGKDKKDKKAPDAPFKK